MLNPANRRFAVADGKVKKRQQYATSAMGSESHGYGEDTHSVSVFFYAKKTMKKSGRERNKNITFAYKNIASFEKICYNYLQGRIK